MGDVFPRLEPARADKHADMERERALLSPVFEEQSGPPTTPALVVHVDIRFTDPVIRSRYCRSYGSSPGFGATNKICRGLVRRIERCSEEFITRKDSGALEPFKGNTYERKSQRFEMTFRVIRRGKGEWAERTYRSYQKQPLTIAYTREVTLAVHRMIGLFLRRHDENFQWLDCPAPEADSEGSETISPSRDGSLSLLSVPTSPLIEATQTFESLPGYNIELYFQSRNAQRQVPTFERRIKVTSQQTAPLTLFMSEDLLWKALQFANHGLDSKKNEFDEHLRGCTLPESAHSEDDKFELDLRVANNLGPAYNHVQRSIKSRIALFRDPEARDCEAFVCELERHLSHIRDEADATLNSLNDLEIRIVELKGVGWTLREPAKFTLGSDVSYGRRTIRAALDRIQTGIGDVIRGHNIAIHIAAHKRGHLVLDKAIVAHEKRGKPKETFVSHKDAQEAFASRLRARIQKDLDKVFEDSCSIDDIPEDEDDYFSAQPITPQQPEQAVFEGPSPSYSPSSVRSSPAKRPALGSLQASPRPRTQRVFSLSRRSTESMRSIDYLRAARDAVLHGHRRPNSAVNEHVSAPHEPGSPLPDARGLLLAAAEVKPARSFSLVSRRSSFGARVSNASTLVEDSEHTGGAKNPDDHTVKETAQEQQCPMPAVRPMTLNVEEVSRVDAQSGVFHVRAAPAAVSLVSETAVQQPEQPPTDPNSEDVRLVRSKQGRMDTPETFVDAREYVVSPKPEEAIKSELSDSLGGLASPREDDEFSTAPSTPELSTGTSSPRHSVLATPVYPRTTPGAKDPVGEDVYPIPAPEGSVVRLHSTGAARELDCKQDVDRSAVDELPLNRHASLQSVPDQAAEVEGSRVISEHASTQRLSEDSTLVVSRQTLDAANEQSCTPRPCTSASTNIDSQKKQGSHSEVDTARLGPDLTSGSEDPASPTSDFPTTKSGAQESGPSEDSAQASSTPTFKEDKPERKIPEPPFAPEEFGHGSELVAACGSDSKSAEDRIRTDGAGDTPGATANDEPEAKGAAEPAAVPIVTEIVAEGAQPGTEGSLKAGKSNADGRQILKVDTRPGGTGMEGLVGNKDVGGGSELPTQNQEQKEPAPSELVCEGSDSAKRRDQIFHDLGNEVPAPETVNDDDCNKTAGESTLISGEIGVSNDLPAQPSVGEGVEKQSVGVSTEPKSVEPDIPDRDADINVRTHSVSGEHAYEVEPNISAHFGAESGDELRHEAFGPEVRGGEIDDALGNEPFKPDSKNVPTKPRTPVNDCLDKHTAPATCDNELLTPESDTLGSSTEVLGATVTDLSAGRSRPAELATAGAQTPVTAPSSTPQATKDQPRSAPVPDFSNLSNLYPVPVRATISDDAASFVSSSSITTTFRNSVDTIRPSTDKQRHPTSTAPVGSLEQHLPHTSSSNRPQTAGYLGIGLGGESRFVEVGLRGALGDGKARRRMSLPLQRYLVSDGEGREEEATRRPSAPASEAGDGGSGELDCAAFDDGQSVLPRMMMLLAGAVAIGKIMKKVAE
ncbi:hypothetical protein C7999DRAFT_10542 [Corynascus novoguineensis]|uniref:Pt repeat family protein n=1 Tax=Corynascus novoguineensis TaxID=1126955 RepID=A0AAN7D1Q7_9PEZI|nr:hypothetical protein C7999DRAFT_10542 [Corynascus novoguineensis]